MTICLTPEGSEELVLRLSRAAATDAIVRSLLVSHHLPASMAAISGAVSACRVESSAAQMAIIVPESSRSVMVCIATRIGELISAELGKDYGYRDQAAVGADGSGE